MTVRARAAAWTAALLLVLAGCTKSDVASDLSRGMGLSPPEIDSKATFAAYRTHDGFNIARVNGQQTGTIDGAGWSGFAPTFRVEVDHKDEATLSVPSTAHVTVRLADGTYGGSVDPSWVDGAIRLTLRPATGAKLHTRNFRTTETTSGISILTRNMQQTIDLRGTYRAELREDDDHVVGWLQVRVWEPSGRRVYEGIFPTDYPAGMETAAAVALDSEIDWIQRYVVNTFSGASPRFGR